MNQHCEEQMTERDEQKKKYNEKQDKAKENSNADKPIKVFVRQFINVSNIFVYLFTHLHTTLFFIFHNTVCLIVHSSTRPHHITPTQNRIG